MSSNADIYSTYIATIYNPSWNEEGQFIRQGKKILDCPPTGIDGITHINI